MAIHKFKMYIVAGTGSVNHGQVSIQGHKPSLENDRVSAIVGTRLLQEVECEFDVPDFDLRQVEIDALEASVKQERFDSQVRVNFLLDRISKLQAIGHEVAQ